MEKPKLSRQGFADEVNRRIAKHPEYRTGMRTFLHPPEAQQASATGYGYEVIGNGTEGVQYAAFAQVEKQVREEFDTEDFASLPGDGKG